MNSIQNPLVSVLMPVYNCETFIQEAINSILSQTFSNFELIIIDDASTDNTSKIIDSYKDNRIKFIQKQRNTGYTDSLNFGLDIAKGDFIARMDGDDISLPDRLQKQVNILNSNYNIIACGTWYETFPSNNVRRHPERHEDIKITLLSHSALAHPSVMLRKKPLRDHNIYYNRNLEPAEDYDLWTRIIKFGELVNIPEVLLLYREHEYQVSNKRAALQLRNSGRAKINMIENLCGQLGERELEYAECLYGLKKVIDIKLVEEIFDWMDRLLLENKTKKYFDLVGFEIYIKNIRKQFTRNFFLNRTAYSPDVINDYLKASEETRKFLSVRDKVVLLAKSSTWWRKR